MPVNLLGRHFVSLLDFSPEEVKYLLDLSMALKRKKMVGRKGTLLEGKNIVLIFEKESTRTRCAFETAGFDEGAHVTYLAGSHIGKKESIEDTAKVLGRFYDGIEFRGFEQETVEMLAKHAGVPVWNGLTDTEHPTQILADFLTMSEHINKPLSKMKLVFVGDVRSNMGRSLMMGAAKTGMHFVGLGPKKLFPPADFVKEIEKLGKATGAKIELHHDTSSGLEGADAIYTDVWVSMGEESLFEERIKLLKDYQVTMEMMKKTKNKDVIFLHCLPAFHDTETKVGKEIFEKFKIKSMEVTDEVFRSSASKVFDQAENRMHTIKAVMVATIGNV